MQKQQPKSIDRVRLYSVSICTMCCMCV